MKMKFLSMIAVAAVLFTSCAKEGDSPDPAEKKLAKIDYGGGSYESITYNADGTIGSVTNHSENGTNNPDHTVYTFKYVNNVLTQLNGSDGISFSYTYDGTKVVKTEISSTGGNIIGFYQYAYSNGRVSQVDAFIKMPGANIPNTPTMRSVNEYYENGNLKKTSIFTPSQGGNMKKVSEILLNEYDTKFNPVAVFENNPFLPLPGFKANNPTKLVHMDANGGVEETVTHTYTYDASGNPLTRKTVNKPTGQAEYTENATFTYQP